MTLKTHRIAETSFFVFILSPQKIFTQVCAAESGAALIWHKNRFLAAVFCIIAHDCIITASFFAAPSATASFRVQDATNAARQQNTVLRYKKPPPTQGAVFLPEIIHITFTRRGFRFYRKAGAFPDKLYRRGLRPHPRPRSPCVRI